MTRHWFTRLTELSTRTRRDSHKRAARRNWNSPQGYGRSSQLELLEERHLLSVSGTKTIGPSGDDYASLGAAIADLQNQGFGGAVTLELQTDYVSGVETFPINFTNLGTSSVNTLTVRPQAGATNLTINSNAEQTIKLDGADYVTIDGRPGGTGSSSALTIQNTVNIGVAVQFTNDATHNTIQYTRLKSGTTANSLGTVYFGTTTGTDGNDYNTIDHCDIGDTTLNAVNSIYSAGSTGTTEQNNSFNTISNSNIFNFYRNSNQTDSTGVLLADGNTDWTITSNSFYQTASRVATDGVHRAIQINAPSGNNFKVTNNAIGGSAPNAGGAPWTTTGYNKLNGFAGIELNVGSDTPSSVQGNVIQNVVWTTSSNLNVWYGIWSGIYVSGGSVNIGTTTGNTIGSSTGTGNISVTTSNSGGVAFGIDSKSSNVVNISNNSIGSITTNGNQSFISASLVGIQVSGGSNTIAGNLIGSTTTANSLNAATSSFVGGSGAQFVAGIVANGGSGSATITNNTVANLNNNYTGSAQAGQIRGIVTTAGVNNITANTVRNLSTTSQNDTLQGPNSAVQGIVQTSTEEGQTVSQNVVHSLYSTSFFTGVEVTGIYYAGPDTGNNVIAGNLVHSLSISAMNEASILDGIFFQGGAFTAMNNMVSVGLDATGASTAGFSLVRGIIEDSDTSTPKIYHNSVYVGGTQTRGFNNSIAFQSTGGTNDRDFRNNIFVNARSNGGSEGSHYAVAYGVGENVDTLTSDNNIYFASGTGGAFGDFGGSYIPTLEEWQTFTGHDFASIYADPRFVNPAGNATLVDLHLQTRNPAEGQGNSGVTISTDFDGQLRANYTPRDIGADANRFTYADASTELNPVISYTPLGNATSTANRVLTGFATITDDGTLGSGASAPRLYYKRSTNADTFGANNSATNGWKYVTASNSSSPYDFTIDYSLLTSGALDGATIQYFVVAQDTANNTGSNPPGAAWSVTLPPVQNINAKPATVNSYVINDVPTSTLSATLTSGNLNITDTDSAGKNNSLTITVSGSNLVISDANEAFSPGVGTLSNGSKTLTIPLSSITGAVIVNGGGGNDTLTVDFAGGNPLTSRGLTFNGGNPTSGPGDKLVLTGGNTTTVAHAFTNAHDGSIDLSGALSGTINYTGLEPITDNLNAANRSFTFNDPSNELITLGNGTSSTDGKLLITSTAAESVTFPRPTNSLTITANTGSDAVSITGYDGDATGNLTAALSVNASGNVSVTGAGWNSSNVIADASLTSSSGAITIDGDGLKASGNIALQAAGAITVQSSGVSTSYPGIGNGTVSLNSSAGTIAISGSGVQARGAVTVQAPGDITISQSGISTSNGPAGGVTVTTTAGNLTVDSGGGGISASGPVVLSAPGNITLGSGVSSYSGAGGNISVSSSGGAITQTAGSISAKGAISISSPGPISIGGYLSSTNANNPADITITSGNSTITAQSSGAIYAQGNVTLTAPGNISVDSYITTNNYPAVGGITINSTAGAISVTNNGSLTANSAIDVTAYGAVNVGGSINNNNNPGGNLSISSATAGITTTGSIGSYGNISLLAPGNISIGAQLSNSGGPGSNALLINSTGGSITIGSNGYTTSFGEITLLASGDISIGYSVSNSQNMSYSKPLVITSLTGSITTSSSGSISSYGNISLQASGNISLAGSVANSQNFSVSAPLTITSGNGSISNSGSGQISSYGSIALQASGTILVGASVSNSQNSNFSRPLTITSLAGGITTNSSGSISSYGNISLQAPGNISVAGSVSNNGYSNYSNPLSITSGNGGITTSNSISSYGAIILQALGNISTGGSSISNNGYSSYSQPVLVTSLGGGITTTNSIYSYGNISLQAPGNISLGNSLSNNGYTNYSNNVSITSASGGIATIGSSSSITSYGTITLLAAANVNLGASLSNNGYTNFSNPISVTSTGGGITTNSGSGYISSYGNIALHAAGNISTGSSVSNNGYTGFTNNISLTSDNGGITTGSSGAYINSYGNIALLAPGNINLGSSVSNSGGPQFNGNVSIVSTAAGITTGSSGAYINSYGAVVVQAAGNISLGSSVSNQYGTSTKSVSITSTGGGITSGSSGAYVNSYGNIALSAPGNITLGSGISNNYGSLVNNVSIVSTGGSIGTTSGSASLNSNGNITVLAPGSINLEGYISNGYPSNNTGKVNITSTGGGITMGSSGSISSNADITLLAPGSISLGFYVSNYSSPTAKINITSTGGSITGTTSATLNSGSDITLLAPGSITLGGYLSNTSNSSSTAKIDITSTGGNIALQDNATVSSYGNVTLTANSMALQTSFYVQNGNVTLRPATAGTLVNLGGSDTAGTLGLTDAELDYINTGGLRIGSATSGNLTLTDNITRSNPTAIELISGGDVVFATGSLDSGNGAVVLRPGSSSAVKPAVAGIDGNVSSLSLAGNLTINIAGGTVDSQYSQLNVSGNVSLSGASLNLSGSYVPAAETFTIVSASNITGEFAGLPEGATVSFNGKDLVIDYTPTAVTLAPVTIEIDVRGAGVSIADGDSSPSSTDGTDFGTADVIGQTIVQTFTIYNTGGSSMTLSGSPKVSISGANASDFTVTSQPAGTVTGGGSTTFQITFDPSAGGLRTASVSIVSDDANEGTYDFAIQGYGAVSYRYDFNAVGSPTQTPVFSVGNGGFIGVLPSDVYTLAKGYGWNSATGGLDRGAIAGVSTSDLLRDAQYFSRTGTTNNGAKTFSIDIANGTYWVNVIMGDKSAAHDQMQVNAEGGVAELTGLANPAGSFVQRGFSVAVSDGQLNLEFSDLGGVDSSWVLNGLDVRTMTTSQGSITLSGPSNLQADGSTVTTFTGTGAAANAILTINASLGNVTGSDASTLYAGTQVQADATGNFTFTVQAPTTAGDTVISAAQTDGQRLGLLSRSYSVSSVRRFDFNGPSGYAAPGFLPVRSTNLYNPASPDPRGFGWAAATGELERTAGTFSALPLRRDGHFGLIGSPGTFYVAVTPNVQYNVRVYVGDLAGPRDLNQVAVEGASSYTITSLAAGAFDTRFVTGVSTDGSLGITISDLGRGVNNNDGWVVSGIDIWEVGSNDPGASNLLQAQDAGSSGQGTGISQETLSPIVAEAIARWTATGLTPAQVSVLQATRFEVVDLGANSRELGNARPGLVQIDDNAAGHGWFIDSTPADDDEFATSIAATEKLAMSGPAAGQMDLLSLVMHELGHELGLEDVSASSDPHHLMAENIAAGTRRLPAAGEVSPLILPLATSVPGVSAQTVASWTSQLSPAAPLGSAVLPGASTSPLAVLRSTRSSKPRTSNDFLEAVWGK